MTHPVSQFVANADLAVSFRRNATKAAPSGPRHELGKTIRTTLPGLLLAAAVAISAYLVRQLPGMATFSPLILAIMLGIAFHNLIGTPSAAKPGVAFSLRRLLRIGGYWYPRGGIPIDVFWQTGKLPKGMWIPDQGVAPYRGRG